MKIPTIGVVISCISEQITYLDRLFDSIQVQTVHPDMVVVSCSSISEEDLKRVFDENIYSFPFKILFHNDRKNKDQNINEASRALNTDIISYFDVEHIMHPQRIECIKQCFKIVKHCKILLHSWSDFNNFKKINGFEFRNGVLKENNNMGCILLCEHNPDENIKLSHCSIRNEISKEIQYINDYRLFIYKILKKYPQQNTYCPHILSSK